MQKTGPKTLTKSAKTGQKHQQFKSAKKKVLKHAKKRAKNINQKCKNGPKTSTNSKVQKREGFETCKNGPKTLTKSAKTGQKH